MRAWFKRYRQTLLLLALVLAVAWLGREVHSHGAEREDRICAALSVFIEDLGAYAGEPTEAVEAFQRQVLDHLRCDPEVMP